MSGAENNPSVNALKLGSRKKPRTGGPFVHHGRHFSRTVHAMCNVQALIANCLLLFGQDGDVILEGLTSQQRKELNVFQKLLEMVPHLQERLTESSELEEYMTIADSIQKGMSSARSDDTKSLKGVVLDWITPRDKPLNPPLSRSVKTNRGFNHPVTGALLCPAGLDWNDPETRTKLTSGQLAVKGDQWPLILYAKQEFDPEDPWDGLFRSELLVWAFKHIFTSPSSVEKENKATRSGNARIHGMTRVTTASLAYVATQFRFALSSTSVFSRSDTSTDSERFYESVWDFLNDPDERNEVTDLLSWWDCQVFPSYVNREGGITKQSALAKLKEKREKLKQLQNGRAS
ncbi:hypothetical protein F5887DRAFT_1077745 [Amanita rubescens]|nr:hypothetical protein F5887DRAFT_1077745 [Amanita rubescens]